MKVLTLSILLAILSQNTVVQNTVALNTVAQNTVAQNTVASNPASQDPVSEEPAPSDARIEAMIILQEISGRPGRPDHETEIQQMVLARDRVLLEDRQRGLLSILRLDGDQPLLLEISADRTVYRESNDLGRIQKDRWIQEKQLEKRSRNLPKAEREQLLKASHLRLSESGELIREIRVEQSDSTEQRLGLPVRSVRIYENDRLITDLLVADLDVPFPMAKFHRASGAFGAKVQDALEKIEGLPLEGVIHVVTATLSHPLTFKITQWDRRSVPTSLFDVPAGCQKLEETAFAHCPICGQQVEREASAARARTREGEWLFFDQRECFQQWRIARQKKAPGQH